MSTKEVIHQAPLSCTAFDGGRRVAKGSYVQVALAVNQFARTHADASLLIFDDATGTQIDFDLRGSDEDISSRIAKRFPRTEDGQSRSPGRPKIGVVPREVTLLPRHWEWLADQPGGASATLRKLVEEARRAGLTDKAILRKLHERTSRFMSAVAGNFPNFEEASRALFANNIPGLKALIADWPVDVCNHIIQLCTDVSSFPQACKIASND